MPWAPATWTWTWQMSVAGPCPGTLRPHRTAREYLAGVAWISNGHAQPPCAAATTADTWRDALATGRFRPSSMAPDLRCKLRIKITAMRAAWN